MRILQLTTTNIGGLHDTSITLPTGRIAAIAGPNGTGKTRLLASLMSLWTGAMPSARDRTQPSIIALTVRFTQQEVQALTDLDRQSGWNQGPPPREVQIVRTQYLETGVTTLSPIENIATYYGFQQLQLIARYPSLNAVYLPAERSLAPQGPQPIDFTQLTEDRVQSTLAQARQASVGLGQLSDTEFESYSRALCVAATLPSESGEIDNEAEQTAWDLFRTAVDQLIYPKRLGSLTRENPTDMRIVLPDGGTHGIGDLSSGERQALIIVSRVFRASAGYSLMVIDEPDVHLHPSLSSRLVSALDLGMKEGSQLIMATHSPSILDGIPPDSIIKLAHNEAPSTIGNESDRLDLYRASGFRASALTQSSMLLVVEGDFDSLVLPKLIPALTGATIRVAGGRASVLKTVEALWQYDLPIMGVIDADVGAPAVALDINHIVHVWPTADLEGALLADDSFLESAIDGALFKPAYANLQTLKTKLGELLSEHKDEAVVEIASRVIRDKASVSWPSPRGAGSRQRLLQLAGGFPQFDTADIEVALREAEQLVNAAPDLWSLVRGKWIASDFVRDVTNFKTAEAFFLASLARQPQVESILDLEERILGLV